MKQRILLFLATLLLFSGMCVLENEVVRARPTEPSGGKASSIYALAGEFRIVFANLLWIKAEQYHHEYSMRDPNWTRDKELMGMLDLITALDPHFVEAYAVGTLVQKDAYGDKQRAMNYLQRALYINPKAWELHHLAAVSYVRWFDDPERALPHALMSLRYCKDQFYHDRGVRLVHTIRRLIAEKKALASISTDQVQSPQGAKAAPNPTAVSVSHRSR